MKHFVKFCRHKILSSAFFFGTLRVNFQVVECSLVYIVVFYWFTLVLVYNLSDRVKLALLLFLFTELCNVISFIVLSQLKGKVVYIEDLTGGVIAYEMYERTFFLFITWDLKNEHYFNRKTNSWPQLLSVIGNTQEESI